MPYVVNLPEDLVAELQSKVQAGEFASVEEAAVTLIRRGLSKSGSRRPPTPPRPPGHDDPDDDRPIQWRPDDVNWA